MLKITWSHVCYNSMWFIPQISIISRADVREYAPEIGGRFIERIASSTGTPRIGTGALSTILTPIARRPAFPIAVTIRLTGRRTRR